MLNCADKVYSLAFWYVATERRWVHSEGTVAGGNQKVEISRQMNVALIPCGDAWQWTDQLHHRVSRCITVRRPVEFMGESGSRAKASTGQHIQNRSAIVDPLRDCRSNAAGSSVANESNHPSEDTLIQLQRVEVREKRATQKQSRNQNHLHL